MGGLSAGVGREYVCSGEAEKKALMRFMGHGPLDESGVTQTPPLFLIQNVSRT